MSPDYFLLSASGLDLGFLKLLKSVGSVVEPFPDESNNGNLAIDKDGWEAIFSLVSEHLHVSFDKIRIINFT